MVCFTQEKKAQCNLPKILQFLLSGTQTFFSLGLDQHCTTSLYHIFLICSQNDLAFSTRKGGSWLWWCTKPHQRLDINACLCYCWRNTINIYYSNLQSSAECATNVAVFCLIQKPGLGRRTLPVLLIGTVL